jgi:hypothetical protein
VWGFAQRGRGRYGSGYDTRQRRASFTWPNSFGVSEPNGTTCRCVTPASRSAAIRLLLLARTAGAWRTDRVGTSPFLDDIADHRIVLPLELLETTLHGRSNAWREAVTAFTHGLDNLAVRLADASRHREGLAAAREAVQLRRELVELNRDTHLPDLARPLGNLAVRLAETGHRIEALVAAQEAVDLRRKLVELNRAARVAPNLVAAGDVTVIAEGDGELTRCPHWT